MTIIPISSREASLLLAGGKGMNLARLTRAGFLVPRGFILPTDYYRAFVEANQLDEKIRAAISALSVNDPAQLEKASTEIRSDFSTGKIPVEMDSEIRQAYSELGGIPAAVRSSATTEDLPDLSFAGQQDTYLNVIGETEVLKAVIQCWSSLWTARAIGYRLRNSINHDEAALAVVVQEMVQSDVSGVLFTANPLTGRLNESVIEATFGLGEALVAGEVEPDHFVVDVFSGEIKSITLGSKKVSSRGKAGGGVEKVEESAKIHQSLSGDEIKQIVELGQQVQGEFGSPQDIEWAFADGKLYLLQSRAITSLFPVPEVTFDPLIIWFSFGSVQGLMGPLTPLGRDVIQNVVAGAGKMFGLKLDPDKIRLFAPAGERIWVRVSDLIRNPIGNRIYRELLGFVEPSVGQLIHELSTEPGIGTGKGRIKLSTLRRLMAFFLPVMARLARNMLRPGSVRARFDNAIDDYLKAAKLEPAADRFGRLVNSISFIRNHIGNAFPYLLPRFIPTLGPSMAALNLLTKIAGDNRSLALETTRGLPNNVTTEMDLALWETASRIRADEEAVSFFHRTDVQTLTRLYLNTTLPAVAHSALTSFLDRYGMRGLGEIDIGQARWREDPTPVMHTIQSYLNIDSNSAPDVLFARGEQSALFAIEKLASEARSQPGGWFKERIVRAAARRIRLLMGARESPKFLIIRLMGIARSAILDAGEEFAAAGTLERPDDLFYLRISELESLSRNEHRDWKALIADRRSSYERERRRRQIPRVLVSDGRAFYEGLGAATDTGDVITGSPVSPGVVEGNVRVVLNPSNTQLAPGEILVCPGTDPAWTPLFMSASGLVTEVGGMMTHGSVVAREYGIPAVVGVHQATTRLKDGQRIQVDGTAGKIVIINQ